TSCCSWCCCTPTTANGSRSSSTDDRRPGRPGAVTTARVFGVFRIAAALTGVVALVGRFIYGLDFVTFSVGNYFGYLTHQSNIAAVGVFAAGAVLLLRGFPEPEWWSVVRMLVTSY